jgi:hypothetical protein
MCKYCTYGGNCYTWTCLLTIRVALPTEIGADGQGPLLITKGNPTSSRGCYGVVSIENQLYQVYQLGIRCRRSLSATSSASVIESSRKQGAGHRGGGSYLTRSYSIRQAQEVGPHAQTKNGTAAVHCSCAVYTLWRKGVVGHTTKHRRGQF